MGRQAAFSGFGGIVFLVGGGLLADLSWRAPFAIYLLGWPILYLVLRHVDEPDRTASRAAAGATGDGLDGPRIVRVAALSAVGFSSMIVFYLTPVQIPFHLRGLGAGSGTVAGLAVAATTLTSALASLRYGALRERLGYSAVFALLLVVMAAGYAAVAVAGGPVGVIAGLAVFGVGLGLLLPNLNSLAGDIASSGTRGTVVGALTTSLFLGQFASPFATQPLVARFGSGGAFGGASALLLVGAVLFLAHALLGRTGPARSGS